MVSTFIGLLDIQSWWEIPCISHFCSLFSSAFNLPDIDIEDLESALLSDGTETTDDHHIALVSELIVRLLKGCDALRSVAKEITHSNYQMFLRRFLRQQCRLYNTENHFDTDIDFQSLPVRKRLLILYDLCHFRLDSADVQVILNNLEADSLRVEPLGYDSKNSSYWYFYGTRLYREDKPAGSSTSTTAAGTHNVLKSNTIWQVICFTEEDWQNLSAKFQYSTHANEKDLYQILNENFLPKLPQLFRERERLRRRKLLQLRNSSRLRNLAELKVIQDKELLQREQEQQRFQKQKRQQQQQQQQQQKSVLPVININNTAYPQTRARRRSLSTSTASGISTYASSLRRTITTNSSEFLGHRETFCLTPVDEVEEDIEERNDEEEEEEKDRRDNFHNKDKCNNRSSYDNRIYNHNNQLNYNYCNSEYESNNIRKSAIHVEQNVTLLTEEHLNLLRNIKLEPEDDNDIIIEETEKDIKTIQNILQAKESIGRLKSFDNIKNLKKPLELPLSLPTVNGSNDHIQQQCKSTLTSIRLDDDDYVKSNRKSHHHRHHHKKKKSQKKQKKKSKDHHRKRHKQHADSNTGGSIDDVRKHVNQSNNNNINNNNNNKSAITTQKYCNNLNLIKKSPEKSVTIIEQCSSQSNNNNNNNNSNDSNNKNSNNSNNNNNNSSNNNNCHHQTQTLQATVVRHFDYRCIDEAHLNPEDKENFCRAIGVVPNDTVIVNLNNHNNNNNNNNNNNSNNNLNSNDLDSNATLFINNIESDKNLDLSNTGSKQQKQQKPRRQQKKNSIHLQQRLQNMAPATNMKLPGRQTNNSLSSLTGNIFIPTALQDHATTSTTGTSITGTNARTISDATATTTALTTTMISEIGTAASTVASASASSCNATTKISNKNKSANGSSSSSLPSKKHKLNEKSSSTSTPNCNKRLKTDETMAPTITTTTTSTSASASASASISYKQDLQNVPCTEPTNSISSDKSVDDFTETDEVLQIGMHKVLVYVKNHRDAWPFMDPVEEDIAPRYYSIIRRPMDLLKMEDKLDNGAYQKFSDFRNDFKLIVNNCRLYNGNDNEYTEMVNNLQEAFYKATKKYFDHLSDDDDDDPALSYPAADSKTNVFREKYFNKKNKEKDNAECTTTRKERNKKHTNKDKSITHHHQYHYHNRHDNIDSKLDEQSIDEDTKGIVYNDKIEFKQQVIYNSDDDLDARSNEKGIELSSKSSKRRRKEKDKRRKKKSRNRRDEKIAYKEGDNESLLENVNTRQEEGESDSFEEHDDSGNSSNQKVSKSFKEPFSKQPKKLKNNKKSSKISCGSTNNKTDVIAIKSNKHTQPYAWNRRAKRNDDNNINEEEEEEEEEKGLDCLPTNDVLDHFDETNNQETVNFRVKTFKRNKYKESEKLRKQSNKEKSFWVTGKKRKDYESDKKYKNKTKSKIASTKLDAEASCSSDDNDRSNVNIKNNNRQSSSPLLGCKSLALSLPPPKKRPTLPLSKDFPPPAVAALEASASELEEEIVDDDSRSMSPFKVDLHKKYSKSALNDDLSELLTTVKKVSNGDGGTGCSKNVAKSIETVNDDLKSLEFQTSDPSETSFKQSPKCGNKNNNNTNVNKKQNDIKRKRVTSLNSNESKKETEEKDIQSTTAAVEQAELDMLMPFLDKYELIKYRRSRNLLNQQQKQQQKTSNGVEDSKRQNSSRKKDTSKMTAKVGTVYKSGRIVEKPRGRKPKSSTKRAKKLSNNCALVNNNTRENNLENSNKNNETKSAQDEKSEKCITVNRRTKNNFLDTAKDTSLVTHKDVEITDVKNVVEFEMAKSSVIKDKKSSNNADKTSPKKKDKLKMVPILLSENDNEGQIENGNDEKMLQPPTLQLPKKMLQKKLAATAANKKGNGGKSSNFGKSSNSSTNLEALDVETEQTLKDINRWLEHTPRFSEFSSASNSPSRYNLLDDFDASITSKIDASEFRRNEAIAATKVDLVPVKLDEVLDDLVVDNNSSSDVTLTKKDIAADLLPGATTGTVSRLSSVSNTPPHSVTSGNSVGSTTVNASSNGSPVNAPSIASLSSAAAVANTPLLIPPPATIPPTLTTITAPKPKETQLLLHPPPPPHIKQQMAKEAKRKSLKEKLQAATNPRRKDLLRTIDRLQPGKAKAKLIQNVNKQDEMFPLCPIAVKTKEVKNSLIVETADNVPKLSLGSVIKTDEFGLGQSSFIDELASKTVSKAAVSPVLSSSIDKDVEEAANKKVNSLLEGLLPLPKVVTALTGTIKDKDKDESKDNTKHETEVHIDDTKDKQRPFEVLLTNGKSMSNTATPNSSSNCSVAINTSAGTSCPKEKPNLSAWFKAFGAPKKSKKSDEEEIKQQQQDVHESSSNKSNEGTSQGSGTTTGGIAGKSPPSVIGEGFSLPSAPRQRKASTGSSISERSSYSQDPDSPRITIEDRYGTYGGGSYTSPIGASPIGASPIMVSPKPDEITKPTSPYPLNGAIKVGFYQDTTTKSSPDKSCSPREMPSPYPQYSQHIYSSASSPNVSTPELSGTSPYGGANSYNPSGSEASKTPIYSSTSPLPNLYDQYNQPRSQESDYNSSMSPSTPNPNSPYQQQQSSPYTTPQPHHSPYHPPNSPYHQPQKSPYPSQNQQQILSPAHNSQNNTPLSPLNNNHQQHSPMENIISPITSVTTQPSISISHTSGTQQQQLSPHNKTMLPSYQQQRVAQLQQPVAAYSSAVTNYPNAELISTAYGSQQAISPVNSKDSNDTISTANSAKHQQQQFYQNKVGISNVTSVNNSTLATNTYLLPTGAIESSTLSNQHSQTNVISSGSYSSNASSIGLASETDSNKVNNDWSKKCSSTSTISGETLHNQQQSSIVTPTYPINILGNHSQQQQQQSLIQRPQYPTYAQYQAASAAAAVTCIGKDSSTPNNNEDLRNQLSDSNDNKKHKIGVGNITSPYSVGNINEENSRTTKIANSGSCENISEYVPHLNQNNQQNVQKQSCENLSGTDYSHQTSIRKLQKCDQEVDQSTQQTSQHLSLQQQQHQTLAAALMSQAISSATQQQHAQHHQQQTSQSQTDSQQQNQQFNKYSQMFDTLLGSMAFGKHLSNMTTDKAFAMYNHAASIGFPKDYTKDAQNCQMVESQPQLNQQATKAILQHRQQSQNAQELSKHIGNVSLLSSNQPQQQQSGHNLQQQQQQKQQQQHDKPTMIDCNSTNNESNNLMHQQQERQQQRQHQQQQKPGDVIHKPLNMSNDTNNYNMANHHHQQQQQAPHHSLQHQQLHQAQQHNHEYAIYSGNNKLSQQPQSQTIPQSFGHQQQALPTQISSGITEKVNTTTAASVYHDSVGDQQHSQNNNNNGNNVLLNALSSSSSLHMPHSHRIANYNKSTSTSTSSGTGSGVETGPGPGVYGHHTNTSSTLPHPLSDPGIMGMSANTMSASISPSSLSSGSGNYYDKTMPPVAHMYSSTSSSTAKNQTSVVTSTSLYGNTNSPGTNTGGISIYGNPHQMPTAANNYLHSLTQQHLVTNSTNSSSSQQQQQHISNEMKTATPAPAKRGRKKKASTIAAEQAAAAAKQQQQLQQQQQQVQSQLHHRHQQQQQQQQHHQQQQTHHQQQLQNQQHINNNSVTNYSNTAASVSLTQNAVAAANLSAAHQLQAHAQALQQGFQLYAGLKSTGVGSPLSTSNSSAATAGSVASSNTANSVNIAPTSVSSTVSAAAAVAAVDAAISLKTAASMVPGSAFNFGPTAAGLGLYAAATDQTATSSYLDQFRDAAANPYYIPSTPAPAHRSTSTVNDSSNVMDKTAAAQAALNPAAAAAAVATNPYSFLAAAAHPSSRATPYPFMNSATTSPLDAANTQLYQQYLRREDFHTRMIFNQSLLGGPAAAGYPQPPPPTAYRPPTLGALPKAYDAATNHRTWF